MPSYKFHLKGFVVILLEFFHSFQQCLLNLKGHLTFMRTDIGIEKRCTVHKTCDKT
jgi:hypothetical protein